MVAEYDEAEAVESVRDDWQHDSGGADCLTREMFMDCVFELADVWTHGVSASEYSSFLSDMSSARGAHGASTRASLLNARARPAWSRGGRAPGKGQSQW